MKKKYLLILILILTVGFASINTVLDLKGNVSIGFKEDDFNVEISKVVIDNGSIPFTLSEDKQSFTFTGTGSNKIEYRITNKSYQYDANVNLVCEPNNNLLINQVGEIVAQSRKSATIESNSTGVITCRMDIDKISKTEIAEDMCEYEEGQTWEFNYTGNEQTFEVPCDGDYKIELWGASGGSSDKSKGGLGSYVLGRINISAGPIFIYVGGAGVTSYDNGKGGGYNGGGNVGIGTQKFPAGGGGGATDIRIGNNSLFNRIIVAAGGGGGGRYGWDVAQNYTGGNAGGLDGLTGTCWDGLGTCEGVDGSYNVPGSGGKQNSSGYSEYPGRPYVKTSTISGFGIAGNGLGAGSSGAGGGGGYYGGGGSYAAGAGGGSSFISGHDGCDAISRNSTDINIIHTGQPNHYSGYVFTNTVMIDGAGYSWTNVKGEYVGMPSHDGLSTMTGNTGHGYAKITYLG